MKVELQKKNLTWWGQTPSTILKWMEMSKRKMVAPSILIQVLCRVGWLVTNAVAFGMVEIAPLYIWQGVSLVFIWTINSGISVGINGLWQQTDNADRQHLRKEWQGMSKKQRSLFVQSITAIEGCFSYRYDKHSAKHQNGQAEQGWRVCSFSAKSNLLDTAHNLCEYIKEHYPDIDRVRQIRPSHCQEWLDSKVSWR